MGKEVTIVEFLGPESDESQPASRSSRLLLTMKYEEEIKRLVRIIQHRKWVVDSKEAEFLKYADEYDSLIGNNSTEAKERRRQILEMGPKDIDYDELFLAYHNLYKQGTKHDMYLIRKKYKI